MLTVVLNQTRPFYALNSFKKTEITSLELCRNQNKRFHVFFTGNPYSIYYFHLLFRPFHLPNYRWFALLPPRIDSIRLDSLVHFHSDRNVTNSRPVWSLYVLIYQFKRKFAYFLPHDFQSFIQFFRKMFFFWRNRSNEMDVCRFIGKICKLN